MLGWTFRLGGYHVRVRCRTLKCRLNKRLECRGYSYEVASSAEAFVLSTVNSIPGGEVRRLVVVMNLWRRACLDIDEMEAR